VETRKPVVHNTIVVAGSVSLYKKKRGNSAMGFPSLVEHWNKDITTKMRSWVFNSLTRTKSLYYNACGSEIL
jgi:hypothetical protein